MKKNLWMMIGLVALTVTVAGHVFAAEEALPQAGVAAAVKGEVKATTPPGTVARLLKSGDKVFMGDKVETGTDGQLQILLLDQTVFTLGPSAGLTVDEFVYDPSNDDGKVKASMLKGIFRVVSGKIAHKKPENMSVELPAGSIGFRGTNVAGIIDGKKSTIVLLGPVGVGRIYVTNLVNGEIVGVDIDEAGNATIVDGPNSAPAAVFQVSEADLNRIAGALTQETSGTGGDATAGFDPNAVSMPQGQVDAQQLLDLLNNVDTLNQTSTLGAQSAAQNAAETVKDDMENSGSQNQDQSFKSVG
ncbi:MAG: FecR domain-containing protein [Candidatus Omnitrophota bacterium]